MAEAVIKKQKAQLKKQKEYVAELAHKLEQARIEQISSNSKEDLDEEPETPTPPQGRTRAPTSGQPISGMQ